MEQIKLGVVRLSLVFAAAVAWFLLAPGSARASGIVKAPNNLGLVGYWSMDDCKAASSTDFSGNGNHGSLTNFALSTSTSNWVTGNAAKRGCALNFDGSNDFVNIGDPANLDDLFDSAFTVSMWVKRSVTGAYQVMLSKQQSTGNFEGFVMGTNNVDTDNGYFFLRNAIGILQLKSTNAVFPNAGRWYHYVATTDGTKTPAGTAIYVDGVSVAKTTLTDTLSSGDTSNNADIYIGGRAAILGNQFNGSLDDVRIYNRALSATEVSALYNSGAGKVKATNNLGLVGYWSMDDCRAASSTDMSGNRLTGSLTNFALSTTTSNWVTGNAAKRGCALNFDGANDYVLTPLYNEATSSSFTASVWFKSNGSITTNTGLFSHKSNNISGWFLSATYTSAGPNNTPVFFMSGGGGLVSNKAFIPNTWNHLVGTYDGTTQVLYLNGAQVGSLANSFGANNKAFIIGRYHTDEDAGYFNGTVDEVRYYNRALSAAEVAALYNSGAAKVNVSSDKLTAGTSLASGLVGHWTFDGQYLNTTTSTDTSGQGNNGTLTNGPVPTIGKLGQALSFDGVDDYVRAATSTVEPTSAVTVSAWAKWNTLPSGIQGLVNVRAASPFKGYILETDTTSLQFFVYVSAYVGSPVYTLTTATAVNNWLHIVGVYDGSKVRLYANGVEVGSGTTQTGSISYDPATVFDIGSEQGAINNRYFNGSLDDVRIYNRALSAAEVLQLYDLGR